MGFKPSPVAVNELAPALNLGPADLALEACGDGRRIDWPIRLRKLRQASWALAASGSCMITGNPIFPMS